MILAIITFTKFAGPSAQGRVRPRPRPCFFVPPLSPQWTLGPCHLLAPCFLLPSSVWVVGPQHHGFCAQSLLKSTFFKMFQFGADSQKLMVFHFLLQSPVILLFLRYLIFPKTTFSMLVPIWDPLGPPKKSIDHFWHPLDSALAPEMLPGPPRDLPKIVQSKKYNC